MTKGEEPAFGTGLAERCGRTLVPLLFEPCAEHLASRVEAARRP